MVMEHRPKKKKQSVVPMEVDQGPSGGNGVQEENALNGDDNDDLDHISDDEEGGVRLGEIYIPPPPKLALSVDVAGPRLIITKIRNNNFKSYAGIQDLGPFHKSFTSIIGPNGSGKSNVIDSMMFVFGYRASRIRSKKISVLIHSSSKYPNCKSATVEVHFCQIIDGDGDAFTVVRGSETTISRTAFKDNTSTYHMNGKRVVFKEIAKMLMFYGIDLVHNRFLILQGEVEMIAMMKPKAPSEHETGMLEFLEDIIGTNRFKEPLVKLDEKVNVLNEKRKEKLNRVRTAEADWKKYHEPMELAVELVNKTNAVVRMRNWVLQKYIHESRKIVSKEETILEEFKATLSKIDEKLAKTQEELREKRAVLNAGSKKYNELRRQKEETVEKQSDFKKKTVTVQAEITASNSKVKNLQQMLQQQRRKLIEFELIPEKNAREVGDCERLLERHKESKRVADEELETAMAGVSARTEGFRGQKDSLKARLMELKKIVGQERNVNNLAKSELKIYLGAEVTENEKLHNMKEALTKAENNVNEKKKKQNELLAALPGLETDLGNLKTKLRDIKGQVPAVDAQVRSLRQQVEQSRQALSANRTRGRVLDSLMEEKRNGNLPGIYGRLGDLGGIDPKYDIAISTSCGALDNIVDDNVETAQACVVFLKKNNIGSATFIVLDKQEHLKRTYERKMTYPENVPRLFDLIRVKDERVVPAFYFALRDTLVAAELEQATRIAYGTPRYRVVTLNGDVIETAGTMSGGGNRPMRGRMSTSVQQDTSELNPQDIEANEKKLVELGNKLAELHREQRQTDESIVNVSDKIKETRRTLDKLKIELKSLSAQVPRLQNEITEQELKVASVIVDPAQKARLEAKVEDTTNSLATAQSNASEVETSVAELDTLIAEQEGGKLKDLRKKVDDLTKKITKITNEVRKLNAGIITSQRNAAMSKDTIAQMETDLSGTEAYLETLKTQKKTFAAEISQLQKTIEELEEEINEGTGEYTGIKEEIDKLVKKEDKRKGEKIEAAKAVSLKEKSLQEYRAREPAFKKDLDALQFEDPGVTDVPNLEKPEPLKTFTEEELEQADLNELRKKHEALKTRAGTTKPNLKDIKDYKAKEEYYLNKVQELETITAERNKIRSFKDNISKKRADEFNTGFSTITTKLKEMYQMITLGGDAELELVDSMDPFTEGVTFSVRPPNKSWKNISNLSGGEKTLSSLALVFALHYYKPTPLYVMDEIDAALDFKNVSIVANYIKERTKNAQFIIISLRYNMFEVSNRLVGIYKTQDCTKCVVIDNKLPQEPEPEPELNSTTAPSNELDSLCTINN